MGLVPPRFRRAIRHTAPVGLWMGAIATLATILGTTVGVWWEVKDDAEYSLEVILVPAVAGFIAAVISFIFVLGAQVLYRLVTGRGPSGSARTLLGLDRAKAKAVKALRESNPGGVHNLHSYSPAKEVEDFASEIDALLKEAGWEFQRDFGLQWDSYDGSTPRDVSIRLPAQGNRGLTAFAEFLNHYGYRCDFVPAQSSGSPTAHVRIGEATH